MQNIKNILDKLDPISLKEMDSVSLLDRIDTKYIFRTELLQDFLKNLTESYFVLDINGIRMSRYDTIYFDTENLDFYRHHHNGKLNRYKIRERCYTDSGLSFFEIKYKNNKSRTIKKRIKIDSISDAIIPKAKEFLMQKTGMDSDLFFAILQVKYTRITLVSKFSQERVTIDLDLSYKSNGVNFSYPSVVIAEVKQGKNQTSPFINIMKENHIRSSNLSKYCIGIVATNKEIKNNNFKEKVLYLKKLCNDKN